MPLRFANADITKGIVENSGSLCIGNIWYDVLKGHEDISAKRNSSLQKVLGDLRQRRQRKRQTQRGPTRFSYAYLSAQCTPR